MQPCSACSFEKEQGKLYPLHTGQGHSDGLDHGNTLSKGLGLRRKGQAGVVAHRVEGTENPSSKADPVSKLNE